MPPSPESFHYDADGNLLEDGRWLYAWDGENRLVQMQTHPEAIAAGVPGRKLTFSYDYMGRRVRKVVHAWHLDVWQPLHERHFIYDGWNLIAERRADGSLIRTYAWGEDVSGSMQGAGDIGGLIAIRDHIENKTFTPACDGNGNVIALVDAATGTTAATYEYDPFGNLLLQAGAYALINPFLLVNAVNALRPHLPALALEKRGDTQVGKLKNFANPTPTCFSLCLRALSASGALLS